MACIPWSNAFLVIIIVVVDVKITAPRPEHIKDMAPVQAALPPYQSIDTDDEDDAMPPEFSRSSSDNKSHSDHLSDVKHPQGLF
jgi:hypothetical protein